MVICCEPNRASMLHRCARLCAPQNAGLNLQRVTVRRIHALTGRADWRVPPDEQASATFMLAMRMQSSTVLRVCTVQRKARRNGLDRVPPREDTLTDIPDGAIVRALL